MTGKLSIDTESRGGIKNAFETFVDLKEPAGVECSIVYVYVCDSRWKAAYTIIGSHATMNK